MMKSTDSSQYDECILFSESDSKDSAFKAANALNNKNLRPRILPGKVNLLNAKAIDWSPHGLLAYACSFSIVIVDTIGLTNIQVLDGHKAYITLIKWSQGCGFNEKVNHNEIKLASADSTCHIRIWDTRASCSNNTLHYLSKSIAAMEWLSHLDSNDVLLLVLYTPHTLILWDTYTGVKLWSKSYTYVLSSFALNPFCSNKLIFHSLENLILIDDFNLMRSPSSNGKKFYLLHDNDIYGQGSPQRKKSNLELVGIDSKTSVKIEESAQYKLNDCVEVHYHKQLQDILLILMPRSILVLDLDIQQCIGIISLEKLSFPVIQIISCHQKDVLFCLQENSAVSVLHQSYYGNNLNTSHKSNQGRAAYIPTDLVEHPVSDLPFTEFGYESVYQSDAFRFGNKPIKPYAIALNPASGRDLALLCENRILFLKLFNDDPWDTNSFGTCSTLLDIKLMPGQEDGKLHLRNVGVLENANSGLSVMKMCPGINSRNYEYYQPLLAVGNTSGAVQIYNTCLGEVIREYCVLSCATKGIEWVSQDSFLCYGYYPTGSQGNVRNELFLVNNKTGNVSQLRKDITEESNIDNIHVSYLMQYFLIVFHNHSVELWDVPSMMLLRIMPKRFPVVSSLAWAPVAHAKSLFRRGHVPLAADISITSLGEYAEKETDKPIKEHFIVMDLEGQFYHFSVDQSIVRDSSKLSFSKRSSNVLHVSWRSHYIALCETDGHVSLCNMKTKKWSTISPERGAASACKFSPGTSLRMLLIFNDGIDIWDVQDGFLMAKLTCPKDMVRIVDAEWVTSKIVILLTHDGCLRIMNEDLLECSAPIVTYMNSNYHFYLPLLPNYMQSILLCDLAMQPWHEKYTLNFEELVNVSPSDLAVIKKAVSSFEPCVYSKLIQPRLGTAERALVVSQLFGHVKEIQFWRIASYYIQWFSKEPEARESADIPKLPTNYGVLLNNLEYKTQTMCRLLLHESQRKPGDKTKNVVQKLILYGQNSRAVQLLMETDIHDSSSYVDSLKACFVEAVKDSTNCHTIVKMVSTNLIAAGKVFEGVELLCLIDKRQDACQYLQNHGYWEESISLAKCTLNFKQYSDLVNKWADHLFNTGNRFYAILLLLSIGAFDKTIQLLMDINENRIAGLLAASCVENQLIKEDTVSFQRALHAYSIVLKSIPNKEECQQCLHLDI